MKSEIRKDYFQDKFVIIAPKRAKRPIKVEKKSDPDKSCYFCPPNFPETREIVYQENNSNGDWEIISIKNEFPALTLNNPRAYGQQEVIIETRRHGLEIHDFSTDHIIRIINAYIDRYTYLRNLDNIRHVVVFKNEGGKAGASISHAHSQIIALPILPPKVKDEAESFIKYRLENGSCPFCDVIKKEAGSERVIWEDENLFVVAPYASDSPYGAWFIPKRHIIQISDLSHGEKESFAKAMKLLLGKLDDIDVSYNYFFENAVNCEDYHMHMKLAPRPNIWAGLELGTGVIINPIPPEFAAKFYRGEMRLETVNDKKHLVVH